MTPNWRRALFVMAALTLAAENEALACSCPMNGPPCQAAWTADVVFVATVRSIDRIDHTEASGHASVLELVRFDVDQAFVSVPPRAVEVVTNPMSTCHYRVPDREKVSRLRHENGDGAAVGEHLFENSPAR